MHRHEASHSVVSIFCLEALYRKDLELPHTYGMLIFFFHLAYFLEPNRTNLFPCMPEIDSQLASLGELTSSRETSVCTNHSKMLSTRCLMLIRRHNASSKRSARDGNTVRIRFPASRNICLHFL